MEAEKLFDLALLSSAQRVEEGTSMQTFLQEYHRDQVAHFTWGYSAMSQEEVRAELSAEQGRQFPSRLDQVLQS